MLDFATFNYTTIITLSILIALCLFQIHGRHPRTVKLKVPPAMTGYLASTRNSRKHRMSVSFGLHSIANRAARVNYNIRCAWIKRTRHRHHPYEIRIHSRSSPLCFLFSSQPQRYSKWECHILMPAKCLHMLPFGWHLESFADLYSIFHNTYQTRSTVHLVILAERVQKLPSTFGPGYMNFGNDYESWNNRKSVSDLINSNMD